MDKLTLAMLAGARAIENTKRYRHATFVHDVSGENPQKVSYYEAAKLLYEVASRREPIEWISVKDRLPEVPTDSFPYVKNYLVVVRIFENHKEVRFMEYASYMFKGIIISRWKWDSINAPYEVTHWMPLPEPPTE